MKKRKAIEYIVIGAGFSFLLFLYDNPELLKATIEACKKDKKNVKT